MMKKIASIMLFVCLIVSLSIAAVINAFAADVNMDAQQYAEVGKEYFVDDPANSYDKREGDPNPPVMELEVQTDEGNKNLKFYNALLSNESKYVFTTHINVEEAGKYIFSLKYFIQIGIKENIPIKIEVTGKSAVTHNFARGTWQGGIDENNRKGPLMTTSVFLDLSEGNNTITIYNPVPTMDVSAGFVYLYSLKFEEMPLSIQEGNWKITGLGGTKNQITENSVAITQANSVNVEYLKEIDVSKEKGFSSTLSVQNATSGYCQFHFQQGTYEVLGSIIMPTGEVVVKERENQIIGNAIILNDLTKPVTVNLTERENGMFAFSFQNDGFTSFSKPFAVPQGVDLSHFKFSFTTDTSADSISLDCKEEKIIPAVANGFETLNGATVRENDDGTATFIFNDARFANGTLQRSTRERITSTQAYSVDELLNLQFHISGVSALHYVGIRISEKPYDVSLEETLQSAQFFTYFAELGIANWTTDTSDFSCNGKFQFTSLSPYNSLSDLDRVSIQIRDNDAVVYAIGNEDVSYTPEPLWGPGPVQWGKDKFASKKVYVTFELRIKENSSEDVHPELTLMPINTSTKVPPVTPETEFVGGKFIRVKDTEEGLLEYTISEQSSLSEDVNWQSELVFSNLKKNTDYYIYSRYKQTNQYLASEPCKNPLKVTTSNAFTMFFVMNGADVNYDPLSSESAPFIKPEDPVKRGHTFGGWYVDEACLQEYDWNTAANDVFVYAKWTVNQYKANFETGVSGYVIEEQSVNYGGLFVAPNIDETKKPNYYFAGWFYDQACTKPYDFNTPVSDQDITLYAKWLGDIKTVSFVMNGSEGILNKSVHYGDKVIINSMPTRSGYKFVGWYTDENLTSIWDIDEQTVTDNMTLYAKWERLPVQQDNLSEGSSMNGFLIAGIVVLSVSVLGVVTAFVVTILRKNKNERKR